MNGYMFRIFCRAQTKDETLRIMCKMLQILEHVKETAIYSINEKLPNNTLDFVK